MTLPLETLTEGKYEILGKIAVGGVGSIYKVRHRLLDEIRVIKVLRREHSERKEVQRRFLHEARAAIRLKHPNIAHIYDFAVAEDGTAYIVMEYIDGVGLDRVLSVCGPPSLYLSLELALQTLQAVAYLHRQGFVHRDLSPDNLMLTRGHDDRPWIKMIDLGIVKNLGATSQMTVAGMFLGKARYSSPEQFSASSESAPIDHRSDIYSFGVVLYQILTGVCPIRGEAFNELAAGHLFHAPIPFDESDPQRRVPQRIRGMLLRALEKDPAVRPTVKELTLALERFRDPAQVTDDEFRQIFVRAFSGTARAQPPGDEGTTQGRMDRQFGIDRTTASGTTTSIDTSEVAAEERAAVVAPQAEAKADAQAPSSAVDSRETLPVDLSTAGPPETPVEPSIAPPAAAISEPPSEPTVAATVGPAGDSSGPEAGTAAPPPQTPAEESAAPYEGHRARWPIFGLIGLFAAAAGGGYLWFRQAAPPAKAIHVERAPTFRDDADTAALDDVLTPGPGVEPPQVLQAQSAEYPPEARRLGRVATVVVAVLVDETGVVRDLRLVEADGSQLGFDEAATAAARGTTFRPATRDGEPGAMWAQLRFEFEP
jgi:TonB family protein